MFDRWCHDIAASRLTKKSDDVENAIQRHEKHCLEEQIIKVDLHIHFSSGTGNKKKEMVRVVLVVMR